LRSFWATRTLEVDAQIRDGFTTLVRLNLRQAVISEDALSFILHAPALRILAIDRCSIGHSPDYDRILAATSVRVRLEGLKLRGAWQQESEARRQLSTMVDR
jgi:hypothetical protein